MKSLYIVVAIILLGSLAQPSMAQVKVVELGHEVSSSMVRMPTSADGELTLQRCATCKPLSLRATAATIYLIDNVRVSFAEMSQYLVRNPGANLVVMQRKDTSDLARIVVHSTSGAQ